MNKLKVLVVLYFLGCASSSKLAAISSEQNILAAAAAATLKDFTCGQNIYNMFSSGETQFRFEVNKFVTDFVRIYSRLAVVFRHEIVFGRNITRLSNRRRRCSIFSLSNKSEFDLLSNKIHRGAFWINGFYLFVLVNGEIPEIEKIFQVLWKKQIFNVLLIFEGRGKVIVLTYNAFKPGKCNDVSPILYSEFINGLVVKPAKPFKLNSFTNLYNCPIRVATSNDSDPFVVIEKRQNGSLEFKGRDIEVINALADILQFKIEYSYIGVYGTATSNGSLVGSFKALQDGVADLAVGDLWIGEERHGAFDASKSYIREKIVFIVPPGDEYGPFEQFIQPLSLELWLLVVFVFLLGAATIFVIRRASKQTQNFVFGTRVEHPYLNMFIGFVGGDQKILPKRNFARFLLMAFLMYSLIVRTVYQASFYQILKSNRHHKEAQTIDEMVNRNYTIYFPDFIYVLVRASTRLSER